MPRRRGSCCGGAAAPPCLFYRKTAPPSVFTPALPGLFLIGFGFFNARYQNLFAVIIAASCADAVWQTISPAIRAWSQVWLADCVVRAAVAPARVGHSSLGYGHLSRKMNLKHLVNELHYSLTPERKSRRIHDEARRAGKNDFFFDKVVSLERRARRNQIDDNVG